jgi:uncharacterized protein YlxW (UPF0749 family)
MPETDALDRANTPLLTLITQQSLDEDYRVVAERRAANGDEPRRRPARTAALVVAAFGLLVTVAAVQTSQNEGVNDASRASLIGQIEASRAEIADLQRQIQQTRELNASLQGELDALSAELRAAQSRVARQQAVSGFGPVAGPGIQVTVDDAPNGEAVADRDLRPLVNGLWLAGAEAIAINGQRLTSRSAIRNSGEAIQVNSRPLSPPYVVSAIGDPLTLQADLMETYSGRMFRDIADNLGFVWGMDNVDDMSLPAAPARLQRLRNVVDPTGPKPNPQKEAPQ